MAWFLLGLMGYMNDVTILDYTYEQDRTYCPRCMYFGICKCPKDNSSNKDFCSSDVKLTSEDRSLIRGESPEARQLCEQSAMSQIAIKSSEQFKK